MGIRAITRDILSLYLGYEIIRGYTTNNFVITTPVFIAGVVLLLLAVWFILERIGVLSKLT